MKADIVFLFFVIAAILVAGAAIHSERKKRPPLV